MKKRIARVLVCVLMLCGAVLTAQDYENIPSVRVTRPTQITSGEAKTYVATINGSEVVHVTAKVAGTLWSMEFKEGSQVKKGDLLFRIEDVVYKANVIAAYAQLKQIQAQYEFAEEEYLRNKKLFESEVISESDYTNARCARDRLSAQINEIKAQIVLCENNLSYTKICAPISGRIGQTIINVGNEVSPASGTLATIVNYDPVEVRFPIREADFLHYFHSDTALQKGIEIIRPDGEKFTGKTKLDFFDNQVDRATGTLMIQLLCENADMQLLPGGYAKIRLTEHYAAPKMAVDLNAVMTDGTAFYVYTVDDAGTVHRVNVTVGDQIRDKQVIESGLKGNEDIIVGGIHKVRPGGRVSIVREKPQGE